jgi:glycosyltransferase involved in cell wall biosynthesis
MGVQILGVGYKVVKQRWGDQINKKVFVFLDRILEQHTRTRLTPIEKLIEFAKTAFLPGDEAVFRSLALTLRKQTRSDELFRAGFLSRDLYNEQVIALCSTVWDTLLVSVLRKKFDWHYLVTLGAVVLAPYLVSANAKNSETRLFQEIEDALDLHPQPRVAWFVDGYSHVDGVSRAIRLFMDRFEQAGKPVKLIICDPHPYSSKMIKRFEPIFSTELKEYRHIVLHVPPALQVLRYLDEGGFTHVLCSSPGPMGFLGLGLGKLMKLPVCGVHHTDFVRFALEITRDPALTDLIRMVGSVYYRYMSKVFARSNAYRTDLVQFGVEADRIDVVPSWTDTDRYRPDKRRPGLFGSSAGLTLLSVGRISEEKNLRFLVELYARLAPTLKGLRLVIVGDGPFRAELEREAQGLSGVRFTGALQGEELAVAYASADVLVFPARHETFGNVVLEAQASGLPAIVANTGGPKEIIAPGKTGFVCNPDFPGEFEEAIERLYNDRDLLERMRAASRANAVARFNADTIIEDFFQSVVSTRAVSLAAPVISRLSAAS